MERKELSFSQKVQCAVEAVVHGAPATFAKDMVPGAWVCEFVASNIMGDKDCEAMAQRENWQTVPMIYGACVVDEELKAPLVPQCHGYGRDDITGKCLVEIR